MKTSKEIKQLLEHEEVNKIRARDELNNALNENRLGDAFELLIAFANVESQRAILKMVLDE